MDTGAANSTVDSCTNEPIAGAPALVRVLNLVRDLESPAGFKLGDSLAETRSFYGDVDFGALWPSGVATEAVPSHFELTPPTTSATDFEVTLEVFGGPYWGGSLRPNVVAGTSALIVAYGDGTKEHYPATGPTPGYLLTNLHAVVAQEWRGAVRGDKSRLMVAVVDVAVEDVAVAINDETILVGSGHSLLGRPRCVDRGSVHSVVVEVGAEARSYEISASDATTFLLIGASGPDEAGWSLFVVREHTIVEG